MAKKRHSASSTINGSPRVKRARQSAGNTEDDIMMSKKAIQSAVNSEVDIMMSYHDNTVQMPFSVPNGYTLVSASFTVTGLSITSGQDPEKRNKVGDVKNWTGNNGSMNFSVGRHGDSGVASWWNSRYGGSKNTFNHNADDLNFAFSGNLVMTMQGGIFGNVPNDYTLSDVGVAQGHSGSTNNWWFGGSSCVYQSSEGDVVRATAIGSSGYNIYLYFRRGNGTPVSTISCYKIDVPGFQTFAVAAEFIGEDSHLSQGWIDRKAQVKMPPYVIYNTPTQSRDVKLNVSDNKLYISINGAPNLFDTSGADPTSFTPTPVAIWVLGTDGQLYASRQNKVCLLHHSTLLGGASVAGAGEMSVIQGVIQSANNASGHYRPTSEVAKQQLTEALKRQGYSRAFQWNGVSVADMENAYHIGDDGEEIPPRD